MALVLSAKAGHTADADVFDLKFRGQSLGSVRVVETRGSHVTVCFEGLDDELQIQRRGRRVRDRKSTPAA